MRASAGGMPTRRVLLVLFQHGYGVRYLARLFATTSTWIEKQIRHELRRKQ